MKWMFGLVLLVFVSLQAVNGVERFERPTQAQIDHYYQDKAREPWRFTYNPLNVGNRWYYSGENNGEPIPSLLGRSVTGDSLINGIQHFYVNGGTSLEWFYECNSGDSL